MNYDINSVSLVWKEVSHKQSIYDFHIRRKVKTSLNHDDSCLEILVKQIDIDTKLKYTINPPSYFRFCSEINLSRFY